MHLFGWGQRPVNLYKAYDCFCRAHSAGCAAATNNRAVCKWLGRGCRQNKEEAEKLLAAADAKGSPPPLRLMALVSTLCRAHILARLISLYVGSLDKFECVRREEKPQPYLENGPKVPPGTVRTCHSCDQAIRRKAHAIAQSGFRLWLSVCRLPVRAPERLRAAMCRSSFVSTSLCWCQDRSVLACDSFIFKSDGGDGRVCTLPAQTSAIRQTSRLVFGVQ
jgi:hypothetical protein